MPAVSVVIPTYKHRDFVLATLDSVFAQTFTDYEVIVVNDGSPDDTAEVLRPLADAGRIRYIAQANAGQAAARNRGIAEAQGEFIALLDDDDFWTPDKLEWQVEALRSNPEVVMAYGPTLTFGDQEFLCPEEDGPNGQAHTAFLQQNWIISPGQTLIRRSALETIGGFDISLWGVDDWDVYIRLSELGPVLYRHAVVLNYRTHPANASKDGWRMYTQSCRVQRKHFGAVPSLRRLPLWLNCRRFIANYAYIEVATSARNAMRRSDWKTARHLWWKALRIKPQCICRRHLLFPLIQSLNFR